MITPKNYDDVQGLSHEETLEIVRSIMGDGRDYLNDLNNCWDVAGKFGIALVPQSLDYGRYRWLACDLHSVTYAGDIRLRPKTCFGDENVAVAICKCAILTYFNIFED